MARFLAGAAACFLLLTGAFLFWQSRAEEAPLLPSPPTARTASAGFLSTKLPTPPEATPKSREEKRFSRADKDKDGRIEREDLLGPRRKAFAKLERKWIAVVRRVGRQVDRQVQRCRQGPFGLADGRRIRDDGTASAEKSALFVLIMS